MSIRSKLIIYTFVSIFVTLLVVAFSIDRIITNLFSNNAVAELENSYSNFQHELKAIETDVLNQTVRLASDDSIVALANLVERYEYIKNYQPLIFDNEKKKAALFLLKQILLTNVEQAVIYSKTGKLIAYAVNRNKKNEVGFITYKKGKAVNVKLLNNGVKWFEGTLPQSVELEINPLSNQVAFLTYPKKTVYISKKESLRVENSRVISRNLPNGNVVLLGVIKVNKSLNEMFFSEVSENGHTEVSLLLKNGYLINHQENLLPLIDIEKSSYLYGSTSSRIKKLTINGNHYIQSYIWPTAEGNNYLIISSRLTQQITALNETRKVFIIAFCFAALLAIVFGIYWLNRVISKPLKALTEKALTTSSNKLPNFPVSKGNDEISLLGKVLNEMVEIIRSREKQITENESQLSHTQKLAKMGGWKIDYNTGVVDFSDEVFSIVESNPAQTPASTELISDLIHPDDLYKVEEAYEKCMKHQIPYELTHRLLMQNGKTKTVHVYSETFFNEKGEPITTMGTIQDVTEQAIKDEQIRRTQRMDALGKFTGGIAHDFNNMLGVIMGFTSLLQELPLSKNEKASKYIHEVLQAANRASLLTSKLLSFSRNKISISESKTNINELILNEQHMLEKTLTVRIQLKLELENDLWNVSLDNGELEDAIINMSINAMHAIEKSGTLILSTRNTSLCESDVRNMDVPAGDYVILSISDTGKGMSDETLQHIFEPFYSTKAEMGTGLGMSQVYGFVQRSKGDIHIYSELGHGTRIAIYFPRYIETEEESVEQIQVNKTEDLSGSATILVVDDELSLRELTKEVLAARGYKVLLAENSESALKILENEHVDLMLSDVIMPGVDGYQLAKIVKQQYPTVIIQMASGFSDLQDNEVLNSDLYKNCLDKPYNSKDLLRRIKELLSS